jgi:hypothetical protein
MVGAGGATTGGVNLLPPLGLRDFSVGDAGALLDEGLDVDGGSVALLPQPAASELTARSVAAQAVTALRRPTGIWFIVFPLIIRKAMLRWGISSRHGEAWPTLSSMSR